MRRGIRRPLLIKARDDVGGRREDDRAHQLGATDKPPMPRGARLPSASLTRRGARHRFRRPRCRARCPPRRRCQMWLLNCAEGVGSHHVGNARPRQRDSECARGCGPDSAPSPTTTSDRKIASVRLCVMNRTVFLDFSQIRTSSCPIRMRGLLIERAEWLIHQNDPRVLREPARNGYALAHATRELVRVARAVKSPRPTISIIS